jgi:hypothetical protein
MLFGLMNTPVLFMRMINEVLRQFLDKTYIYYLDDILIYSRDEGEHIWHIREILETL